MPVNFESPLKLSERQLEERLRLTINFECEAMEPTDDSFYMSANFEYRNMDRLQFNFYELSLLQMWERMAKQQIVFHVPEICDLENPCD